MPKFGKYKLSAREYEYVRLQKEGGTVGGSLNIEGSTSIEGDADILNTLSASAGSFLVPGDLLFQTVNGNFSNDILSTTNNGTTLGIYNNLIYIDGTNLGIGTVTPAGKLEVVGTVVLSDLPTTQPTITGSLWVSGSSELSNNGYLVVFTG